MLQIPSPSQKYSSAKIPFRAPTITRRVIQNSLRCVHLRQSLRTHRNHRLKGQHSLFNDSPLCQSFPCTQNRRITSRTPLHPALRAHSPRPVPKNSKYSQKSRLTTRSDCWYSLEVLRVCLACLCFTGRAVMYQCPMALHGACCLGSLAETNLRCLRRFATGYADSGCDTECSWCKAEAARLPRLAGESSTTVAASIQET